MAYEVGGTTIIGDFEGTFNFEGLGMTTSAQTIGGNYTFNLNNASVFRATVTGTSHNISFSNFPANNLFRVWNLYIIQSGTSTRTYSFQSGTVLWTDGVAPVITQNISGAIDVVTFCTYDGGSTIIGNHSAANLS